MEDNEEDIERKANTSNKEMERKTEERKKMRMKKTKKN